jgi:hypothetical protein
MCRDGCSIDRSILEFRNQQLVHLTLPLLLSFFDFELPENPLTAESKVKKSENKQ